MNSDAILSAFALNGSARGRLSDLADVPDLLSSDMLVWAHLDADHADTRALVSGQLDAESVSGLLADDTRPRAHPVGQGVLLILRGVNLNAGAAPEDMISLRLWIDLRRILTLRKRDLRAVSDVAAQLDQGTGPDRPGAFLVEIVARLVDRMEPVLDALEDGVAALEEQIVAGADSVDRREIAALRRRIIILRRYIAPQREAVRALRDMPLEWLAEADRYALRESGDRMLRHVEDLDMLRERAQVVKDELANTLADRLNRNLYVLAIISAIFLPLGFITGLLGVNVGGVPGADLASGFWWLCGGLVALGAGTLVILRRFGWL